MPCNKLVMGQRYIRVRYIRGVNILCGRYYRVDDAPCRHEWCLVPEDEQNARHGEPQQAFDEEKHKTEETDAPQGGGNRAALRNKLFNVASHENTFNLIFLTHSSERDVDRTKSLV